MKIYTCNIHSCFSKPQSELYILTYFLPLVKYAQNIFICILWIIESYFLNIKNINIEFEPVEIVN